MILSSKLVFSTLVLRQIVLECVRFFNVMTILALVN